MGAAPSRSEDNIIASVQPATFYAPLPSEVEKLYEKQ